VELPEVTMILDTEAFSKSEHLNGLLIRAKDIINEPDLVIILSANCAFNHDNMWILNSTRGYIDFTLTVNSLMESQHINNVGGFCPDPYKVAMSLLDRIEDPITGLSKIQEVDLLEPDETEEELKTETP